MTPQKSQIKLALQAAKDVLNAAKQGPEADWLILDCGQARVATTVIAHGIRIAEQLSIEPKLSNSL